MLFGLLLTIAGLVGFTLQYLVFNWPKYTYAGRHRLTKQTIDIIKGHTGILTTSQAELQ